MAEFMTYRVMISGGGVHRRLFKLRDELVAQITEDLWELIMGF